MIKNIFYVVYDYFTFNQNKYLRLFKKLDKLREKNSRLTRCRRLLIAVRHMVSKFRLGRALEGSPLQLKKDLPDKVPTKKFKRHETSGSTGEQESYMSLQRLGTEKTPFSLVVGGRWAERIKKFYASWQVSPPTLFMIGLEM